MESYFLIICNALGETVLNVSLTFKVGFFKYWIDLGDNARTDLTTDLGKSSIYAFCLGVNFLKSNLRI